MTLRIDAVLAALARTTDGVISIDAARSAGVDPRRLADRADAGVLERLDHGVYLIGGVLPTWARRQRAASLASGGPSSHLSAARLLGLWHGEEHHVLVPPDRWYRNGIARPHRSTLVLPEHLTTVDGIPCTTPARTLIDVASVVGDALLTRLVDRAMARKLVTDDELVTTFVTLARRGRPGIARARRVLESRVAGMARVESELELIVLRLLVDAGLPTPVLQHEVFLAGRAFRLDLAYPRLKIAIECDGRVHAEGMRFDTDRVRQNLLIIDGWLVLRVTWPMATDHPTAVVADIRRALAARSRPGAA